MKIKSNEQFADIASIQTENGDISTDPILINERFKNYYSDLYRSDIDLDKVRCDAFLSNINLPKLSEEGVIHLSDEISLGELREAVAGMQKGKSPGMDGIPPELYLVFWDALGPLLLDMIHCSIRHGAFSRDLNIAMISLLLKKNKDPTDCSSYRPLSLLNADIKIFAKLLSNRLKVHMPSLINSDQTGFIKSRYAADNLRRLLHIIDAASDHFSCSCTFLRLYEDI